MHFSGGLHFANISPTPWWGKPKTGWGERKIEHENENVYKTATLALHVEKQADKKLSLLVIENNVNIFSSSIE